MQLRTVLSWVLVAGGTGCILFVDAEDTFSDRCRFNGDATSPCGICVANACKTRIDACCAEEGCRNALMGYLDQCSLATSKDACPLLQNAEGSARVTELQDCIRLSCASACAGSAAPDGGKPQKPVQATGKTYCDTTSSGCWCSYSEYLSNGTACGESTVTNGICCADKDYGKPGGFGACTCISRGCSTGTSCSCASGGGSSSTATTCSGTRCCKTPATSYSGGGCSCSGSTSQCPTGDIQVTSCSIGDVGCPTDKVHVTSCSQ